MRTTGTVVRWDGGRGFGFIRTAASSADVFFHVRDFRSAGSVTPREGLEVAFDVIHVGGKGPRAVAVHLPGVAGPRRMAAPSHRAVRASRTREAPPANLGLALGVIAAYGAALAWGMWTHAFPWWLLPYLAAVNVVTFFAYWQDKHAAEQGRWRTPESTLHLWGLAGGWPLAWVAQQVLRHKSIKREFQATYWISVVMHLVVAGGAVVWLSKAH